MKLTKTTGGVTMKKRNYKAGKALSIILLAGRSLEVLGFSYEMIFKGHELKIEGLFDQLLVAIPAASVAFLPIPYLIAALLGLIFSARAIKKGETESKKYLIISIINIVIGIAGLLLSCRMWPNMM